MNNWLLHILKESIKVSLIAVSVEQLIYLFLTRWCLLPIPSRTLQWHPCPLGSQNYLNKDGCGWGSRDPRLGIRSKKGGSGEYETAFTADWFRCMLRQRCFSRLLINSMERDFTIFFQFFFFENSCWRGVWKDGGTDNRRLADGAGEERVASSGRNPWELWDWLWDRLHWIIDTVTV